MNGTEPTATQEPPPSPEPELSTGFLEYWEKIRIHSPFPSMSEGTMLFLQRIYNREEPEIPSAAEQPPSQEP